MYIPYIFYTNEDGYVDETKFRNEMEKPPAIGEKTSTFYNESVNFYNLSGAVSDQNENYIAQDGKFTVISADEVKNRLIKNLQAKYLLADKSGSLNISYEDDLFGSVLGQMRTYFYNNNIQIPDSEQIPEFAFSENAYKENVNEFFLLSSFKNITDFSIADIMNLRKMQYALNTLLLQENIINVSDINNIQCFSDITPESEEKYINYSKACRAIYDSCIYHNTGQQKNKGPSF